MFMHRSHALVILALTVTACGEAGSGPAGLDAPAAAAASSAPTSAATPGMPGKWPDLRPPTAASCVSQYPDELPARANAFDATVAKVTVGDFDENAGMRPATVDLAIHEVFAGPERQSVQLHTWDGFLPQGNPQEPVGLRVLASAGDTLDLMACGFTRPYSQTDADAWRRIFAD